MSALRRSPTPLALCGEVDGSHRIYLLGSGVNRIGSRPDGGVVLAAKGVSKRHALLVIEPARLSLEDLGSKNGTYVGGERITSRTVQVGDELQFGSIALRLEELDPDDGDLAIPMQQVTPGSVDTGAETTPHLQGQPVDAGPWLALVEAFFDRLFAEPQVGLSGALALLVRELDAEAAAVLELPSGEDVAIRASFGDFDEESVVALATLAETTPGPEVTVQKAPATADGSDGPLVAVLRRGATALALTLWGGRESELSPSLLRLLLRCVDSRLRSALPAPAKTSRPSFRSGLVFPDGIVRCESPPMRRLHRQVEAVADSDLPLLILGETGVGKEGIARLVRASSGRRDGPFVPINCAAIPAELLEAELFGIGKGVATGVERRQGKFQLAQGGTLLLDEVGDMSGQLQAKLLRALEEKQIQPVGASPVAIDVRVVAATNTHLEERMERGAFRTDLYYRLAGCILEVPPLRQRRDDIPILVEHFLYRSARETVKSVRGISVSALNRLMRRSWPGNVRQLEHEVRRLLYQCADGQTIVSDMIEEPSDDPGDAVAPPELTEPGNDLDLATVEKRTIEKALRCCDGNQSRAARLLGITRTSLYRRLLRHGLSSSTGR